MKQLADRLAMQHLINAYAQESFCTILLEKYQQNSTQFTLSQGQTLLSIVLKSLDLHVVVPLAYVSRVGRHRISELPTVFSKGKKLALSPIAIVTLLLEQLVQDAPYPIDSASLVERWVQSRSALLQFLHHREQHFSSLIAVDQDFIQTEQALLLGHSMHPAPKSRLGFVHEDWQKYSPESAGQTQLHYWLINAKYVAEGSALHQPISKLLLESMQEYFTQQQLELINKHTDYKLLPLHPWQARYLQTKDWFKSLKAEQSLIDLGELAWSFFPTTSVRTMASFDAPWMFKPSLSVMITNSVRVNLAKECHRGQMTHELWHSDFGQHILKQCPTLKAVNDPAWLALEIDGQIVNETICIFREQPFKQSQQITCIASLCQDHMTQPINRFNLLFQRIAERKNTDNLHVIAKNWFQTFLDISLKPLMYLYHQYGMAFESHQQNVLVELEDDMPKFLWLRDNQGFYYIEEYATEILKALPDLGKKAHAVGSKAFVDERFSYYFFGNTLFGLINAIGATGYIHEDELIAQLQQSLLNALQNYPDSSLLHGLLYQAHIPYKGNLLTRMYELDELTAPVEFQSVYIQLQNPLFMQREDVNYA